MCPQRVTVPFSLVAAGIPTSGDCSTRKLSVPGRGSTGPCQQHRGSAEGHHGWRGTEEAVATREHSWEDEGQQRTTTSSSWGLTQGSQGLCLKGLGLEEQLQAWKFYLPSASCSPCCSGLGGGRKVTVAHSNQFIILFCIPSSPGPLKRVPGSSCAVGIGPENGSEAIKKAVCCGGVKGDEFVMFGSLSCRGAQSAVLFLLECLLCCHPRSGLQSLFLPPAHSGSLWVFAVLRGWVWSHVVV